MDGQGEEMSSRPYEASERVITGMTMFICGRLIGMGDTNGDGSFGRSAAILSVMSVVLIAIRVVVLYLRELIEIREERANGWAKSFAGNSIAGKSCTIKLNVIPPFSDGGDAKSSGER
jgi:hypothetical protein